MITTLRAMLGTAAQMMDDYPNSYVVVVAALSIVGSIRMIQMRREQALESESSQTQDSESAQAHKSDAPVSPRRAPSPLPILQCERGSYSDRDIPLRPSQLDARRDSVIQKRKLMLQSKRSA